MTALDTAIAYVRKTGNPLDRLRLRRALGEPFSLSEAEEVLAPYQFPKGSWDYDPPEEKPSRIGSLGGTIHCLRWLREFRLSGRQQMVHTLEFLSTLQAGDGSFYETKEKLAHSPQSWLQKETIIDRFYFTAAVPMRLLSLGCGEHPILGPAIGWLERHCKDWDLVTGTWYSLWALLCINPKFNLLDASQYRRGYAKALEWLPRLEAPPLAWLLDALHGAGYPADEPLVTNGMTRLSALQDVKGLWSGARYSLTEVTVTALRLIRDYPSAPCAAGEG